MISTAIRSIMIQEPELKAWDQGTAGRLTAAMRTFSWCWLAANASAFAVSSAPVETPYSLKTTSSSIKNARKRRSAEYAPER